MGILIDEILASYDWYQYDNPDYAIHPGKRYQQSLHYWGHGYSQPKGSYRKDPNSASFFWWFYKALHNPPTNEKIVSLIRNASDSHQIWVLIDFFLASRDLYNTYDVADCYRWLGKIYSQNLQTWWRKGDWAYGVFWKTLTNWWHFYKAVTKNPPASEKIVNMATDAGWGAGSQI